MTPPLPSIGEAFHTLATLEENIAAIRERLEIIASQMAEDRAAKAKQDAVFKAVFQAAALAYVDTQEAQAPNVVARGFWRFGRGVLKAWGRRQ